MQHEILRRLARGKIESRYQIQILRIPADIGALPCILPEYREFVCSLKEVLRSQTIELEGYDREGRRFRVDAIVYPNRRATALKPYLKCLLGSPHTDMSDAIRFMLAIAFSGPGIYPEQMVIKTSNVTRRPVTHESARIDVDRMSDIIDEVHNTHCPAGHSMGHVQKGFSSFSKMKYRRLAVTGYGENDGYVSANYMADGMTIFGVKSIELADAISWACGQILVETPHMFILDVDQDNIYRPGRCGEKKVIFDPHRLLVMQTDISGRVIINEEPGCVLREDGSPMTELSIRDVFKDCAMPMDPPLHGKEFYAAMRRGDTLIRNTGFGKRTRRRKKSVPVK